MLKLIGILTVIAVSTLYGLRAAGKLSARRKNLELYIRLIGETEDKIRCRKSLEEIFSQGLAAELLKYENYTVQFKKDSLKSSDTELLNEFFSLIGFGDIKS